MAQPLPAPLPPGDGHDDDRPVGRVLTRREILALLGVTGTSLLAACAPLTPEPAASATQPSAEAATAEAMAADPTVQAQAAAEVATVEAINTAVPNCVVRPELTEGPYFVDTQLNRADIRVEPSDGSLKEGMPLELTFRVSQVGPEGCAPLAGAIVDVWHCDALGVYSGVRDPRFDTSQLRFLRGYQVTDDSGIARFTTIYPGWYSGRAVHIHFKIRTTTGAGSTYDFTSQLFFDETINAAVYAHPPYAEKGLADVPNAADGIYRNGGEQLILAPTQVEDGYTATFEIGLDLSA